MHINTNLAADASAINLQHAQLDTPAASNPSSSSPETLDASWQRLLETPASIQDADYAIQDETGADQAMESLRQSMLGQPGLALAAQGNQLSGNVLSLLQPID